MSVNIIGIDYLLFKQYFVIHFSINHSGFEIIHIFIIQQTITVVLLYLGENNG